jgi:hypothetical protein
MIRKIWNFIIGLFVPHCPLCGTVIRGKQYITKYGLFCPNCGVWSKWDDNSGW